MHSSPGGTTFGIESVTDVMYAAVRQCPLLSSKALPFQLQVPMRGNPEALSYHK